MGGTVPSRGSDELIGAKVPLHFPDPKVTNLRQRVQSIRWHIRIVPKSPLVLWSMAPLKSCPQNPTWGQMPWQPFGLDLLHFCRITKDHTHVANLDPLAMTRAGGSTIPRFSQQNVWHENGKQDRIRHTNQDYPLQKGEI